MMLGCSMDQAPARAAFVPRFPSNSLFPKAFVSRFLFLPPPNAPAPPRAPYYLQGVSKHPLDTSCAKKSFMSSAVRPDLRTTLLRGGRSKVLRGGWRGGEGPARACNCGDLDKCCLYFITQVGRGGIKDLPQSSSYPDFKQSVHTGLA
jgi:hypothetical protein